MTTTERKRARSPQQPTGCWIVPARRLAIYIRDGFACAYCGTDLKNAAPRDVTLDHLLPRSLGGSNASGNLVTACRSCNSSRGNKAWMDFAPGGAIERITRLQIAYVNVPLAKSIIAGDTSNDSLEDLR